MPRKLLGRWVCGCAMRRNRQALSENEQDEEDGSLWFMNRNARRAQSGFCFGVIGGLWSGDILPASRRSFRFWRVHRPAHSFGLHPFQKSTPPGSKWVVPAAPVSNWGAIIPSQCSVAMAMPTSESRSTFSPDWFGSYAHPAFWLQCTRPGSTSRRPVRASQSRKTLNLTSNLNRRVFLPGNVAALASSH